jgi:hypothetical protein
VVPLPLDGWLRKIKDRVGAGVTGYDVAAYMDWYLWLKSVSDLAGCDLGDAPQWYNLAAAIVTGQQPGTLDEAYYYARMAVSVARAKLVEPENQQRLTSAFDERYRSIKATIDSAKSVGIDVSGFERYVTKFLDVYRGAGGRQICVGLWIAEEMRTDLSNYINRWVSGAQDLEPRFGLYDILAPSTADATDVLVLDQLGCEATGPYQFITDWQEETKRWAVEFVQSMNPNAQVLEVRFLPPKVVIFIKSPFPWDKLIQFIPLLAKIIGACVAIYLAGNYIVKPIARAIQVQAEVQRDIAKIMADTQNNIINNPNLSEQTKKELIDAITKGFQEVSKAAAPTWSLSDIVKVAGAVMVLGLVMWGLSQLPRRK